MTGCQPYQARVTSSSERADSDTKRVGLEQYRLTLMARLHGGKSRGVGLILTRFNMSGITYADLLEQYAKLEKYASYPEDGEWVLVLPINKVRRISRALKRTRRMDVRARILKYRRIRWRIMWK